MLIILLMMINDTFQEFILKVDREVTVYQYIEANELKKL